MAIRIYSRSGTIAVGEIGDEFDLGRQGARLEIPDNRLYYVGDKVTVFWRDPGGVSGPSLAEFAGYESGTLFPIFKIALSGGRAQFWIGTNLDGRPGNSTYAPGPLVTDTPLGVGVAAFADYGLRVGATDVFNTQNREIEFDQGVYEVDDVVELRIISGRDADGDPIVERTVRAEFAGYDPGTYHPLFDPLEDINGSRRQIIAASAEQATYEVPAGNIVAKAWPPGTDDSTFSNYGFRRANADGDFDGDFALQGAGGGRGLDVPEGVYRPGDALTIQPFRGAAGAGPVAVRYLGHVADPGGGLYPVFEAADLGGEGPAQIIGTNEPHQGAPPATYSVDPSDIVTNVRLGIGVPSPGPFATFADYGLRVGATNTYNSQNREVEIDHGVYRPGDRVGLRIIAGDGTVEHALEAAFAGYERGTGNLVFDPPSNPPPGFSGDRRIVLAKEEKATYELDDADIVTDVRLGIGVPSPGPFATFADYGLRAGATNIHNSQNREVEVDHGVYRPGDRVGLRIIAADGTVEHDFRAAFAGYDRDTGNPVFYPPAGMFGGRRIVLAKEEAAAYGLRDGAIVADRPLGIGVPSPGRFATFADFGLRAGATDAYDPQGREVEIDHGAYRSGGKVGLRVIAADGTVEHDFQATLVGRHRGTGNLVFDPPAGMFGGRRIVVAKEEAAGYEVADGDIAATGEGPPFGVGVAVYPGVGISLALASPNSFSGQSNPAHIAIPEGVYRPGTRVEIPLYGNSETWRFVGYEKGTDNPIFFTERAVGFPARLLLSDREIGGTREVDPADIVTDGRLGVGVPSPGRFATFADYGLRAGATDAYDPQGREIEIDHGVYEAGDMVELRIVEIRDENGHAAAVEAFQATFVGHQRGTGDPVFDPPADMFGGRRIVAAGAKAQAYELDDIVTDAPHGIGFDAYSNWGYGADNDFTFELQNEALGIPEDGLEGDPEPGAEFCFEILGEDVTGTLLGYERGTGYPVFEIDGGAGGARQIIFTDEPRGASPGTAYDVDPDDVTPDPDALVLGTTKFSNFSFTGGPEGRPGRLFRPSNQEIEIRAAELDFRGRFMPLPPDAILEPGEPYWLEFTSNDRFGRFIGYEKGTNYPVFFLPASSEPGSSGPAAHIILHDLPHGQEDYRRGEIVSKAYMTCFAPGTLIATPDGERAVEALEPGDMVLTADGGAVPVKWVGFQRVPIMFGPREITRPVRIKAGALGEGAPHTDLVVTKDHGIILDGVICHAGALANGTSIAEVPAAELDAVSTYYHVETEGHVQLLANGAAAESFIDQAGREGFDNYPEFATLHGKRAPAMAEMDLPRAMSARQVPQRVRTRLAQRAAIVLAPAAKSA